MIAKVDCPYCDERIEVDTDDFDEPLCDGDIFEVTCPYCKRDLDIEVDITIKLNLKD